MITKQGYQALTYWLRFLITAMIAIAIPCSNFFMSLGGISLAVIFLISPDLIYRSKQFFKQPLAVLCLGFFLLHIAGLAWTENLEEGYKDIRIKLPLLLYPIAFAGLYHLKPNHLLWIIRIYVGSVIANTFLLYGVYLELYGPKVENVRDISIFISHIRFSLNVCLAIILLCFYPNLINLRFKNLIKIIISLWCFFFLSKLESATALITLISLATFIVFYYLNKLNNKAIKYGLLSAVLALAIGGFIGLKNMYSSTFLPSSKTNISYPTKSLQGETLIVDNTNFQIENGQYVYRGYARKELKKSWKRRTKVSAGARLDNGYPVIACLHRYLTSKHLSKDSLGVYSLTEHDIQHILNGETNYKYVASNGFTKRIYKLMFEWHNYKWDRNPNGHSMLMRFEFLKAAAHILQTNWLAGVGTGDLKPIFSKAYSNIDTNLEEKWQHRAHNQFLSIWIAFGVFGLILMLFIYLSPFINKSHQTIYGLAFLVIALISFLIEDTLETQAGVTFVTFFYSLFFLKRVKKMAE